MYELAVVSGGSDWLVGRYQLSANLITDWLCIQYINVLAIFVTDLLLLRITFCLIIIKARWPFRTHPWMINQWAFPNVHYGNSSDISLTVPIGV